MDYLLEFEKPVFALENQIRELELAGDRPNIDLSGEIAALRKKVDDLIKNIYANLSPWEQVQLARHPLRPHSKDFIELLIPDFYELHGDRRYADDQSMLTGIGRFQGIKVAVIGIEKGRRTQDKIKHNFGMPHPEGYRKALRIMQMAAQFHLPIITFVDTPGAYPGIGAEERGQAQAIAENLEVMSALPVPIISVVIGEGGSGGALGVAVADVVLMMEYAIYSVISPESCASILWSDPKLAEKAANSLKLTALKAREFKIIDGLIDEPSGGAHRDRTKSVMMVGDCILAHLKTLQSKSVEQLVQDRFNKFRTMGNHTIAEEILKK